MEAFSGFSTTKTYLDNKVSVSEAKTKIEAIIGLKSEINITYSWSACEEEEEEEELSGL